LGELLTILWGGRWIILGSTLLALLLGTYYVWRATPIYQMEALLQVEAKQTTPVRPALEGKVEGLSEGSSQAQAQVEILLSNQTLGRVVQALHLDLVSTPKTNLFFGSALFRGKKDAPWLDVEIFDLPEVARGQTFTLEAKGNGAFAWKDPDDEVLADGRVGQAVQATWQGRPMNLKVRNLVSKPGQRFILQRLKLLEAIENLRKDFFVTEKGKDGKETNILALAFKHPDPVRGAEILNAILDQCSRENIERKTGEASRTLAFIHEQMAQARDKLMKSEQLLSQYRGGGRSGDLGEEARLVVQRSVDLEREILTLNQRKQELLRTYQAGADVVVTVDQQIAKFQDEAKRLNAQGRNLPHTQQEVMRLTRDVQVNQERYSSLMNLEAINSQQLQMAQAGDIGNARIVDLAIPSLRPVKPNRPMVIGLGLLLGVLTGIGLVMLRRSLHPVGVEDPQVLEGQFGLPVLATIPHSNNQADLTRQTRKKGEHAPLLSTAYPGDIAVESFRSLRTSLHFTMVDAPNRAIMFAGASPEIGKSFVCANFAVVLAQYGSRVLLVDADMRRGKLHRHFGAPRRKNGLSEVLVGSLAWQEALHHAQGLDMISTGILPPNPSKLLLGERFGAFLAEVCAAYDYVIIDAPPIMAVTDAAIIGAHVGAAVIVVKDGQHPLGEIRAAIQSLDIAGVRAKGFVFNDVNPKSSLLGYQRYAYHYTYQS
jgi:tyrosine-protein kinase Etk/Wzc